MYFRTYEYYRPSLLLGVQLKCKIQRSTSFTFSSIVSFNDCCVCDVDVLVRVIVYKVYLLHIMGTSRIGELNVCNTRL